MREHDRPDLAGYSSSARLEERLGRLVSAGMKSEEIGRSRGGRPILAYHWTAPTAEPPREPRRGVFLLSLLHPMEWIGVEANIGLLERWILGDRHGETHHVSHDEAHHGPQGDPHGNAREVGRETERGNSPNPPGRLLPPGAPVFSIPVANPDGFARVETMLREGPRQWIRGNLARVDLNRNFPAGYRGRPRWLAFWPFYRPGSGPLSEPEATAIARWVHGRPIGLSLSLHSFGRKIFYPPCSTYARASRSLSHQRALEEALRTRGDSRNAADLCRPYAAGQLGRWSPFFRAFGTEIDFLAEETGGLSYLIEISAGGFGRWGARRLLHPFFLFNPPHPELELEIILPMLQRLAASI